MFVVIFRAKVRPTDNEYSLKTSQK